jgi:hypothetical protein
MGYVYTLFASDYELHSIKVRRSSVEFMPWYAGKQETRQYLEEVNKEKQVRVKYHTIISHCNLAY